MGADAAAEEAGQRLDNAMDAAVCARRGVRRHPGVSFARGCDEGVGNELRGVDEGVGRCDRGVAGYACYAGSADGRWEDERYGGFYGVPRDVSCGAIGLSA